MELDIGPKPEDWVTLLLDDARDAAKATVAGLDDQTEQLADMGGMVTRLADAVGRMATTVQRTRDSAMATKHAVTAVDWFWRQCKTLIVAHRKVIAGGACLMVGLGGHSFERGVTMTIGDKVSKSHQSLEPASNSERLLASQWDSLTRASAYWRLAQSKHLSGDTLTSRFALELAAEHGHPVAAILTHTPDSSSP